MKTRYIYIASPAQISYLNQKYAISSKFLRISDNLFKISTFSNLQGEILNQIGAEYAPLISVFHGEDLFLKIIPETSLISELANRSFTDRSIAAFFRQVVNYFTQPVPSPWEIKGRTLSFERRPLVMGIVNVTPDSFSDGGKYYSAATAYEHSMRMIEQGVHIVDVGGESTRPGAAPVSAEQEMERVIPVIERIRQSSDIFISVDTYKAAVADAALNNGADIINDISGTLFDPAMETTVKRHGCPYVAMHTGGRPQTMQKMPSYKDVVEAVYEFLEKTAGRLASITKGRVMIDPGIGFGKTANHNLRLISHLKDFSYLGYPVLLGVSRKSFLGVLLKKETSDRETATVITQTIGAMKNASVVRTHDVESAAQIWRVLAAVDGVTV